MGVCESVWEFVERVRECGACEGVSEIVSGEVEVSGIAWICGSFEYM